MSHPQKVPPEEHHVASQGSWSMTGLSHWIADKEDIMSPNLIHAFSDKS